MDGCIEWWINQLDRPIRRVESLRIVNNENYLERDVRLQRSVVWAYLEKHT